MKVLVFNCGSSSLKYKLIDSVRESLIAGGEAQRVGPKTTQSSVIFHRTAEGEQSREGHLPNHYTAFKEVMKLLAETECMPDAIGHRVVHGAKLFSSPVLITEEIIAQLHTFEHMAPIHNPPAIQLMEACLGLYPELPQAAVFDTAYHSSIPDYAHTYALPRELSERMDIRKYGFHGTSHQFVVEEAAKFLNKPLDTFRAVSCHLGSGGASLCAVVNGKSMDNTMGFSPLQGLIMSTRSGDFDAALTLRLLEKAGWAVDDVERTLNNRSGVLGLSGVSSDIRDILSMEWSYGKNKISGLDRTAQVYLWRLRKYVGAYLMAVGPADAIIFTDTIGETVPLVRHVVCTGMDAFGIQIDPEKNNDTVKLPVDIALPESPVRILVIQTDEELAISRRVSSLLTMAA
ncbi:MAG: acetate/propionate family kinase [Candidatus Auribacterota bacterium]